MTEITVTKEMSYALKEAKHWFKTNYKPTFEIAGAAGTGKTTLVYYIINELNLDLDDVLFMAFTGKAALQLTHKGTPATTIHSIIYEVYEAPIYDEFNKPLKDDSGRALTRLGFRKRKKLDSHIKLLVIDEGSMIGEAIAKDLLSFEIPIIVLGDLNQLPPVSSKPTFLKSPDIVLTEIFRQDKDNPIIYLSQKAIAGEKMKFGRYGKNCFIVSKEMLTDVNYSWANIVICAKNKTRDSLNGFFRSDLLKIRDNNPIVGDKIICRKNNRLIEKNGFFLTNGMIGFVDSINKEESDKKILNIDFQPEFLPFTFENLSLDFKFLTSDHEKRQEVLAKSHKFDSGDKFEYGYVISAHLSQGSQYKNVLVYNEFMGGKDFYAKWLYTAITRAEDGLIIAL